MGKGVIIICDECKKYVCPSSCPSFGGRGVGTEAMIGECTRCQVRLYSDDAYFEREGRHICAECAEELISDELLDILNCSDIKEFFEMLW